MKCFSPLSLIVALSVTFSVGACTPVGMVLGAGTATGLAAYQERGVDGVARDLGTSSRIFEHYLSHNHVLIKDIAIEVYEGRVMLTGFVPSEALRADAVRLAWQVDGVQDVINEIQVNTGNSVIDSARDHWISTSLQTQLTFDEKVYAINYAVETVGGTVYLIGIAQNAQELERVKNHARSIAYVQHIVSHVRIKSLTQAPTQAPIQAQTRAPVQGQTQDPIETETLPPEG